MHRIPKLKRKNEAEEPPPHNVPRQESPQRAAWPTQPSAESSEPASASTPGPAPAAAPANAGPPAPAPGDAPPKEHARQTSPGHTRERPPARRSYYRVLLVDDHAVVRRGLRTLLASQTDIEVCGEAATGPEALELLRRERPDLVMLDLTLPGMDGLELMEAVRQQSPSTEILVLTMHFSDELARAATS